MHQTSVSCNFIHMSEFALNACIEWTCTVDLHDSVTITIELSLDGQEQWKLQIYCVHLRRFFALMAPHCLMAVNEYEQSATNLEHQSKLHFLKRWHPLPFHCCPQMNTKIANGTSRRYQGSKVVFPVEQAVDYFVAGAGQHESNSDQWLGSRLVSWFWRVWALGSMNCESCVHLCGQTHGHAWVRHLHMYLWPARICVPAGDKQNLTLHPHIPSVSRFGVSRSCLRTW